MGLDNKTIRIDASYHFVRRDDVAHFLTDSIEEIVTALSERGYEIEWTITERGTVPSTREEEDGEES